MIDPGTAALLAGGIGTIASLWSDSQAKSISEENLQFERDRLNYQIDLQERIFNREDNAVQRRAADLEAAGFSKTLAAGGAANAGAVVSTQAPQKQMPNYKTPESMIAMAQLMRNVNQTDEQIKLIQQQVENAKAENVQQKLDTAIKARDFKRAIDAGMSYNATGWAKDVKEIIGFVKGNESGVYGPTGILDKLKKGWNEAKPKEEPKKDIFKDVKPFSLGDTLKKRNTNYEQNKKWAQRG